MDMIIGPDGTITLTAEMLGHLGLNPGDRVSVLLTANHHVELSAPARAPGEKLLKGMLSRVATSQPGS